MLGRDATMADQRAGASGVRLAELMAALSLATDLGNGQPMEFSLCACVLAIRLGEAAGLSEDALRDVYYYALLRHVGCNAESHALAAITGDELALRRDVTLIDAGQFAEWADLVTRHLRQARESVTRLRPAQPVVADVATATTITANAIASFCEAAQLFSRRLGFSDEIERALGQIYERWDGRGLPRGLAGEDVALPVRVVVLAQDMVIFNRLGGVAHAVAVARERSEAKYDPRLVEAFTRDADRLLHGIDDELSWEQVLTLEPGPATFLTEARFDVACQVIADFADLKSPYTLGHSPKVADLAAEAGRRAGLPAADVTLLRRAGWLHELGRVSVSANVWTKVGPLSDREREQVRLHPYYTERILARPAILARLGALASLHHERLDGSGYHRGVTAAMLSPAARVLAAANAYQAMLEPRPHRQARPPDEAAVTLQAEARAGRLDHDAVRSVLAAAGHRVRPARRELVAGLSEREVEVLRLIARGHSIKQIARALSISTKTVDTHIQHIYGKIGVSTRAGAALFAVEQDLLTAPPPILS